MKDSIGRVNISAATPSVPLRKGYWIAVGLSMLFLIVTAYSSAGSMFDRIGETDINKAAAGGAWSGVIALQITEFVVALLVLHIAFGTLAWVMAAASAQISTTARSRFPLTIVCWFCMLMAAVISYNALWFPRTLMGAYYFYLMSKPVGPVQLGQVIYQGVAGFGVLVLALAAWSSRSKVAGLSGRLVMAAVVAAIAVVSILSFSDRFTSVSVASAATAKPNVIILGVDSLRLDELRRFGSTQGITPNLDRFLADADLLADTSTPAARTFSSWVAILSGRSPRETGARCNLTNRKVVAANPTFADVMRESGYRTVYSTDEVRFANIDQSYGFDQVITPPIGAADFLIGTYNELPLASVVANTGLGRLLFPFSNGNRGVAMLFQPETFLDRVDRELQFDRPTLFISHLTASHWPYYTSETPFGIQNSPGTGDLALYGVGLRTADSMFGRLMGMLKRKGALNNAIVIVLSDHGEAFGLDSDSIYRTGALVKGLGAPMKMTVIGHGQSVLSPTQYKTLLAFRAFGRPGAYVSKDREYDAPATVEDIAPTFLELLGIRSSEFHPSGHSMATMLRTGNAEDAGVGADRIRYTETDLGVMPATNGTVDEVATARVYSKFFGVDAATGRLAIRDDFLPLAFAYKERAAFSPNHLIAAMPAGPYHHQYLYFDLATGAGQLLLDRPGPELAEGQRLWDALHDHFQDELKPATRVTVDDWQRIGDEWTNFFVDRKKAEAAAAHARPAETPPGRAG